MSGTLTHSPANILRHLLINEGFGTLPSAAGSWPIFATVEPDHPDNVITVYNTTGIMHAREMINGEFFETPGIQIRVRNTDTETGFTKAHALAIALDETIRLNTVIIDSTTYTVYAASRKGSVIDVGKEAGRSKRHIFTVNGTLSLRQE